MANPPSADIQNPTTLQSATGRVFAHPDVQREYSDIGDRVTGMGQISQNTLILMPASLFTDMLLRPQSRDDVRAAIERLVPQDQLIGFVRQLIPETGIPLKDGTTITTGNLTTGSAALLTTEFIYANASQIMPGENASTINLTAAGGVSDVSIILMPPRGRDPQTWFGGLANMIDSDSVPFLEGRLGTEEDWVLAISGHEAGHARRQINEPLDMPADERILSTLRGEILGDRMLQQFGTAAMGINPDVLQAMEYARAIGSFRGVAPSFIGQPIQDGQIQVDTDMGELLGALAHQDHQTSIFLDDPVEPDAAAISEGQRQMQAARDLLAQRLGDWSIRVVAADPDAEPGDTVFSRTGLIDEPSEMAFLHRENGLTEMSNAFLNATRAADPAIYNEIATRAGYSQILGNFLESDSNTPMEYMYTRYMLENGDFARIGPQAQEFAADYVAAVEAMIDLDKIAQDVYGANYETADQMYQTYRRAFINPTSAWEEEAAADTGIAPAPPPAPVAAAPGA
jgi:hypothetical protein